MSRGFVSAPRAGRPGHAHASHTNEREKGVVRKQEGGSKSFSSQTGNSFLGAAARDPWFHARPATSSFSPNWLSLQVTAGVARGNKSSNWLASSPLYRASAAARRTLMLSPFATNSLNVFKSESASKLSISTQYSESPMSFISVATFE